MSVIASGSVSFDTSIYRALYICLGLLVLKVLLMVVFTARYRFKKKVVITPEDAAFLKGFKVKSNDPDVERVRRAHLNDLENIIPFAALSCWYAGLNPSPYIAIPLFFIYTIARYAHTYVFVVKVIQQPARIICFVVGMSVAMYMSLYIILSLKDSM